MGSTRTIALNGRRRFGTLSVSAYLAALVTVDLDHRVHASSLGSPGV